MERNRKQKGGRKRTGKVVPVLAWSWAAARCSIFRFWLLGIPGLMHITHWPKESFIGDTGLSKSHLFSWIRDGSQHPQIYFKGGGGLEQSSEKRMDQSRLRNRNKRWRANHRSKIHIVRIWKKFHNSQIFLEILKLLVSKNVQNAIKYF